MMSVFNYAELIFDLNYGYARSIINLASSVVRHDYFNDMKYRNKIESFVKFLEDSNFRTKYQEVESNIESFLKEYNEK